MLGVPRTSSSHLLKIYGRNTARHTNRLLSYNVAPTPKHVGNTIDAIEEHNTISEVIEEIKSKRNSSKDAVNRLLNPVFINKQIVFSDKPPTRTSLMSSDSDSDQQAPLPHSSFKLSDQDIRDLPISATSYQNVRLSGIEKAIQLVAEKENLKVALEHALAPHLKYLEQAVRTDKDLLDICMSYLDQYLQRDTTLETQTKRFMEVIQKRAYEDPSKLPQPYSITLPATIRYIFESGRFTLPGDRNYIILKTIYNKCKSCKDLGLYLDVCNIDFYNLLVKFMWEEYKDLAMVKDTIYEMDSNGITGDIATTELLEDICHQVRFIADDMISEDVEMNDVEKELKKTSVLWSAENVAVIDRLTKYLKTLKRSLMR
ncbi:unnamed protein product [Kluyveromyces dobzhanskii CBS 2104]|uniref:WGS project CCBQ000000000 data, contig 00012 n=1 Tax=Kluyveromyces dobzhanskii CBS 2104 TaxID=1427455 RepID=A0A0A8L0N7_9SACH|nr:unnamed protein product [Kluyveromyces dobzhanskii CBS 2104]